MRIYLSGPIEYAEDHGVGWRKIAKAKLTELGHEVIDPCDLSLSALATKNIQSVEEYNELKHGDRYQRALYRDITQLFIEADMKEVRKADVVLAMLNKHAGGGTSGEITLARFLGVPVVAFVENDESEISGWIQSIPHGLFVGPEAMDDAITYGISLCR